MSKPSIDTESVAQDQIRSFFERWQRLEEEKRAISDDLKELFAEAKAMGFDTKVMRKLFRDETGDHAERLEFEAIYELYAAALGTRNANARDAREDDDSDDTNTARETLASTTAADPAGEADDASSADTLQEGSEPIGAHNADRAGSTPAPATTSTEQPTRPLVDEAGRHDGGIDRGSVDSEPEGASISAKPSMASEPATEEGTSPQPSSVVPGRQPGCLNPDTCAGTWRKRCASCERAFMAVAAGGQAIVHQGAVS